MKTALLFILLLLANTFVHSQIDVNSTRTNSFGDLQLRRHSAGDTAWKRALVIGYNPSNANGKLYLNYGGDFKDGVKINGSLVSIDGKVGIGTTNPIARLSIATPNSYSGNTFALHSKSEPSNYKMYWDTSVSNGLVKWKLNIVNVGRLYANRLVFDRGNVGIGTISPDQKLTVQGNVNIGGTANTTLRVRHIEGKHPENTNYDNLFLNYHSGKDVYLGNFWNDNLRKSNLFVTGKVGIGTNTPSAGVDISRTTRITGNASIPGTGAGVEINYSTQGEIYAFDRTNSTWKTIRIRGNKILLDVGNVGIGTTNPREKLAVNGNIRAKEVKIELENWPDYVFTEDYDLPSLKTVKDYISKNGHLPDIPAATEVQKQGIALGNMNAKLLQKIEELTL